jgi:RNA polymerase sigma-70 factor (ECF subfamily)
MSQTDEQLADKVKDGDEGAFQELMGRYMKAIYSFGHHYVKTNEEAEDVAQETFFKTWKYIKRYKTGKPFKPWIYTIARNTALDYIKKKKAVIFSDLDSEETDAQFADTLPDTEPLQPELFERAESAAILRRALETLHPDHKSVMVMHYEQEMTFEEIAVVVGKPMNTVKSWHRRALTKMKKHIQ